MMEISSTHQHDMEQAQAAFRNTAEILGMLKRELVKEGFTTTGAESIAESMLMVATDE